MRVLWFSPIPSLYHNKRWGHNGGGWIGALERIVRSSGSVELGVAFEDGVPGQKEEFEGVVYYPMYFGEGPLGTLKNKIYSREKRWKNKIDRALRIIDDFRPEVIHMFGSESWYGLLAEHTDIPIVVHMQGSLPAYYNARYPAGISVWDKIVSPATSWKQKLMAFRIDSTFRKDALREEHILKINRNFMGRTHWDRAIVKFYNPAANYFVCNEAIREGFMNASRTWSYPGDSGKVVLVSTISGPLYKGMDVILKTADMLKKHTSLDFEWHVCGVGDCRFMEDRTGIKAAEVGVRLLGVVSEEVLREELLGATFYVHPSYIDNSPNSVCEAQIMGLPVIATDVGGVSSLVRHGETGFLVPANDPLMIASIVVDTCRNRQLLEKLGARAKEEARRRHDPEAIKGELISVYRQILKADKA